MEAPITIMAIFNLFDGALKRKSKSIMWFTSVSKQARSHRGHSGPEPPHFLCDPQIVLLKNLF